MTIEFIGTSAGSVWTALNEADALGIKQLKKITKLKEKEIYAALGWLAREGKVNINVDPEDAKELIVSLTQDR
ncbi:MAG: winged helix-turn-helix domain-containing protein [Muribaculaceae bacterium]|nr:winged helix-turn-helix domain-containing protein [Muribaculaceae bacterium]MDE5594907.1 winged helix-turn-helix domain-containing protein [Muribaculaceae bacterium]